MTALRTHHRLCALLAMLCWLFAAVHVAAQHGGVADGGAMHALLGCEDGGGHDDFGSQHDGEHHQHHELTPSDSARRMEQAAHIALLPAWIWLFAQPVLPSAEKPRQHRALRPPPDARASGWLLICRTVRQVRAPSLAA